MYATTHIEAQLGTVLSHRREGNRAGLLDGFLTQVSQAIDPTTTVDTNIAP